MTDQTPDPDTSDQTDAGPPDSPTGAPRWVKVFWIIIIAVVLLVVILLLMGGHGPSRHT
jgi:hypothetical protein